MTMFLGHRGDVENFSSSTKESVISAFEKSDGVEVDLNISKDGIFFIYHEGDWTDHRLCRERTIDEIRLFCPPDETLLTLTDSLEIAKDMKKYFCLHLEPGGGGLQWAEDFNKNEMEEIIDIFKKSGIDKKYVLFHTTSHSGSFKENCILKNGYNLFYRLGGLRREYGMYRLPELLTNISRINTEKSMAYTIDVNVDIDYIVNNNIGFMLTDKLSLTTHLRGSRIAREQWNKKYNNIDLEKKSLDNVKKMG